jgi:hypothetical protein
MPENSFQWRCSPLWNWLRKFRQFIILIALIKISKIPHFLGSFFFEGRLTVGRLFITPGYFVIEKTNIAPSSGKQSKIFHAKPCVG